MVGFLDTEDSDKNESQTYALVDSQNFPDNLLFKILKNELRTLQIFDFEKQNKFLIKIRSTNSKGLFYEKEFEILINDIPEKTIILSSLQVHENKPKD